MSLPARVLLTQFLATVAAGAAGTAYSLSAGCSALLGGLVCLASNAWFLKRLFGAGAQRSPEVIFGQMVRGEAAKIALAGVMFAAIYVAVEELVLGTLIAAYLLVHAGGLAAALAASGNGSGYPQIRDRNQMKS